MTALAPKPPQGTVAAFVVVPGDLRDREVASDEARELRMRVAGTSEAAVASNRRMVRALLGARGVS